MPSTSRTRGSGRGSDGSRPHILAPMSERQQLALIMQLSSQDIPPPAPPPPVEEKKRNKQQRNERGETPLHVAAIRGDHDLVKKFLDQGHDPDVPDFAGWTPLHEACSYGWYQVVVALINGGANVNAKGLDDDTPLHDAATSGNLKMVKLLVDHGADPFFKNAKGKMPVDYAASHMHDYIQTLKDNARVSHHSKGRDDHKKSGNASNSNTESSKKNMESLAQADYFDGKDSIMQDKGSAAESKDETQIALGLQSHDEATSNSKRIYKEETQDLDVIEKEVPKSRKRKDNEEKDSMPKPISVARVSSGRKQSGSSSKADKSPLGKSSGQGSGRSSFSGKSSHGQGKSSSKSNSANSHQSKSGGSKSGSVSIKQEKRSPVASPKSSHHKDVDGDSEEPRVQESALKVPPLKIVLSGAGGSGSRNDQDDGGSGSRGSGKGRGNATLPYVIPYTSTDTGQASDSSEGNSDEKKGGQRILRSHKTNDGERDKSPQRGSDSRLGAGSSKSPTPSGSNLDEHGGSASAGGKSEGTQGQIVELHPRKRKIKSSKDHSSKADPDSFTSHIITHSNPYQMYLQIKQQIRNRQKSLFPVKPKPPKDFNKYLMNRRTYTLHPNVNMESPVDVPHNMPIQMLCEFISQEKERTRLRLQHLVEKEKLVLAVEQEILRVHGRAERAVANQALPFSVCTILRDKEVYNLIVPEQEEKRNAQRSRCNGRQINSWLQEVDDKWEKIKESMLRRQHTEAETLHATQMMSWEWKLKDLNLTDHKITTKIDPTHVPQIHVSNFDLPA